MILMDRENLLAPGWSHVLSTSNDVFELELFRELVGAPPRALHLKNPRRPHLDLRGDPRGRALETPGVLIFEGTRDLLAFLRSTSCRLAGTSR
jgi:hypothetical protein